MRVTESYERWTRGVKQSVALVGGGGGMGVGWGGVGWWWAVGNAIVTTVLDARRRRSTGLSPASSDTTTQ